jgi:hypothetical protein
LALAARNVSVTLAYVASRGISLSFTDWPNSAEHTAIIDGRKFFAPGPSPEPEFRADPDDHERRQLAPPFGAASVEWRPTAGFGFNASYTYAKSTDDVSVGVGLTDFEFSGRGRRRTRTIAAPTGAVRVRRPPRGRLPWTPCCRSASGSNTSRALMNGWR